MRLRRASLISVLVACAAAAPAQARVSVQQLSLASTTVQAASAQQRSCFAAPLGALDPAAAQLRVTVPVMGSLRARLGGSPTGPDWDLAVFDAVTHRLVGASAAFGGNELVTAPVTAGQLLLIQACRYSGDAPSIPLRVDESVVSGLAKPQTESLVAIHFTKGAQLDRLAAQHIDLNETARGHTMYAVIHSARDLAILRRSHLRFSTTVPDLAAADRRAGEQDRAAGARSATTRSAGAGLPSGRTSYRQLQDYEQDLKDLVAQHPAEIRPVILPHLSVEGRTVEGIEMANDVAATDDGRPVVVQLGLHHAREWSSGEVVVEYALTLAQGDGSDARITRIMDGERNFMFPVINPDGFQATMDGGGYVPGFDDDPNLPLALEAAGEGSYRRKNCADVPGSGIPAGSPCAAQDGVDLNRNYGAFWGGPGASYDMTDQTYRGPSPYSEPETQNVHDWASQHQIMVVNSNHNFAADVLYQPGFSRADEPGLKMGTKVPYQDAMKDLSDRMAKAAGYVSEVSYDLYDVTGATEDWDYFAQGAFGYTTETGYDNFHPDYQDAVTDQYLGTEDGTNDSAASPARPLSMGLRESMLITSEAGLDAADHSTLTGTAPPGDVLRLQKTFTTSTSNVVQPGATPADADVATAPIQIPEHLDSTLTVPASGTYTWAVDPSTRPVVLLAGGTEAWTMTCEDGHGTVLETQQVVVAIGETKHVDFTCGQAPAPGTDTATATATTTDAAPAPPAPPAAPKPVAKPSGLTLGAFRRTRKLRHHGRRVLLEITATGALPLRNLTGTLTDAKGHVVARATRSLVRGADRLIFKTPHRLGAGTYHAVITARTPSGATLTRRATIVLRRR